MTLSGGLSIPDDHLADYVAQGYLSSPEGSLTATMIASSYPGGVDVNICYVAGQRIMKPAGSVDLTHTYTASKDTYDDIDSSGVISHTEVPNNDPAPSLAINSLRLQKVVTDGSGVVSVTRLADTFRRLKGPHRGRTLWVDQVIGSDEHGIREQRPFKTVEAAIAAAQAGDVITLRPGTYEIEPIVLPTDVTLQGLHTGACTLFHQADSSISLVTMGSGTELSDLKINIVSDQVADIDAVKIPDATASTCRVKQVDISIDNCTISSSASSELAGIRATNTDRFGDEMIVIRNCSIKILSAGYGKKRAVLVSSSGTLTCRGVIGSCTAPLDLNGSYIAFETDNPDARLYCAFSYAKGTNADISETDGKLVWGGTLANGTTNNTNIESQVVLPFQTFADAGGMPSNATRFMRVGTSSVTAAEAPIRIPQPGTIKSVNINSLSGPGLGKTDTFTIRKNQIDTAAVITLSDTETSNTISTTVPFVEGDNLSIKVVTAVGTATSDVTLVVEFIK